ASEEKFRNLFNNANIGMFRTKFDGSEILDFNDKFLEIFGRTREEMKGGPSVIHWADPEERTEMMRRLLAANSVRDFECRMLTKQGKIKNCLTSLRLYPVQGILEGAIIDITERKQAEAALQNAQKLEAIGVLAAGIAHDFNNLLGGIFGYIDMANEAATDRTTSGHLAKALATIDRARGLTQQLLTFAKGGTPVKKLYELSQFIKDAAQFALSGSRISCNFQIPEDLWLCAFDKNQIGQVIDNIVINAQQAMPEGGTIEVSALNKKIENDTHITLPAGNYVIISIKDHGIGMPKEILGKIYDPFYTTKSSGHGLGLATCYSIINRHGGGIEVESEPGAGSTFHIYLPAKPQAPLTHSTKTRTPFRGSGTVLVMDDEEVIRETISAMLQTIGYSVFCVSNGTQAIEFIKQVPEKDTSVSAIVLDLTIPGGPGGKEIIREILKIRTNIPVFVASGYADDPVMANPAKYGFAASISKPFRKRDLIEMFRTHIGENNKTTNR
ncbi:MAG: ATP-binding protein, partial [Spirochaetia bacterium]